MRLPDAQMSELLKFGLRVNELRKGTSDGLSRIPDDVHNLLKADRSVFCVTSGSGTNFKGIVRRIELACPVETRKWSNDCCVVRSYALQKANRDESSRAILTVGRNQLAGQIICAMYSGKRDSESFSTIDFAMCHLAVGYVLDSFGWHVGLKPLAYEATGTKRRRLSDRDASLLSGRMDQFLLDT